MKRFNPFSLIIASLLFGLVISSCNKASEQLDVVETKVTEAIVTTPTVLVEAEGYKEASVELKKESNTSETYIVNPEAAWMSYDVNVPEAGRYKVEVNATALTDGVKVWLEDYIENTDGRTYNVTGSIPLSTAGADAAFSTTSVDGSPLNKGVHKMKLHVDGGSAKLNWIKLTQMIKHQVTPKTLTQKMDGEKWELVWSDEFNGSGIPDTDKWTFDVGNWGWGNNELQYYTADRPENARQENGNLIIEARKNDMDQAWTSARLTTRGKVSFLYGKIEFKAQVPRNRGNWAAGWTLGDSYVDEISWPYCGEIDIMESVGYEVNDETGDGIAHCTVHTPAYYFKINNQISSVKDIKNIAGEFHTYAVEWTPTEVRGYVDGEQYYVYDKNANEKEWPFAQSQNIILNLAMGGGWGGAKGMDESMTSQSLLVDYVRVYEKR